MKSILRPLCLLAAASWLYSSPADAFFPNANKPARAKSTPQQDQAIEIFRAKFPFGRPPLKPNKLLTIGMPNNYAPKAKAGTSSASDRGKRLSDITEAQARASFSELARLYGPDEALSMVQVKPIVLSFKVRCGVSGTLNIDGSYKRVAWLNNLFSFFLFSQKADFASSLQEFSNIFGEEEAKGMVVRNPGLLAVTPAEAARTNDSAMQASYIIGATAPFGNILLPLLMTLLLVPAAEGVTGIPIRDTFLATLGL